MDEQELNRINQTILSANQVLLDCKFLNTAHMQEIAKVQRKTAEQIGAKVFSESSDEDQVDLLNCCADVLDAVRELAFEIKRIRRKADAKGLGLYIATRKSPTPLMDTLFNVL